MRAEGEGGMKEGEKDGRNGFEDGEKKRRRDGGG